MKTTFPRLSIALLALSSAASAAPFLAIGDGAELFATGLIGIRADDNVFLNAVATSDTIFDITPGAELTFGKDSDLKGSLTLTEAFTHYSDNNGLNTNLFSGDLNLSYNDGKMKLAVMAGFHESNQNTFDNRDLNRRDIFNLGTKGEVEISQITSVGGGITATHTNYKRTGYGDSDDLVIPLNFYYKVTEKLDLSVGYKYRDFQTKIGEDSTDHFINVGARGAFTPLLNGEINVGVTTRKLSGGSEESMLGLSANLNYELTPKTQLQLNAANSPDTSPQGIQQKNFSLGAIVTAALSDQWSVKGGLSYRGVDFTTRVDDYIEGQVGVTYILNTYVNFIGAYAYRHNSSVIASGEFTNNVFSIAANLRY
jgi:hypothetical protein